MISTMSYEEKIVELGLKLPQLPEPLGVYLPVVKIENLLFLSGVLPLQDGKLIFEGKVGSDLTVEEGYEAARIAVLNALAIVSERLGSLDEVRRIVKVVGYVASAEGFNAQPKVVDGASELLAEIFGEKGGHARVAVGVNELPLNAPIELEMMVQVR